MEVHSHSHTERKKWTHYFWEFLMLFLAVFCGFLAENFREHQLEKSRAKQYISSLYEDLKNDTIRLNGIIAYDEDKVPVLNGMDDCFDAIAKDPRATSCMSVLIKYSRTSRAFSITDRTIRQLANSGGYRILSREDADSIIGYENLFKEYENFQTTIFQGSQDNVRNTLNLVANFKAIRLLLKNPSSSQGIISVTDTIPVAINGPLLIADDRVLLNKWFNELSLYARVTAAQRRNLLGLKEKANDLILYFSKKYGLK